MRSELILSQFRLQTPKKLYRKTYANIPRSHSAYFLLRKKKTTSHAKTCVESVLLIKFDSSQMLGVETEYY